MIEDEPDVITIQISKRARQIEHGWQAQKTKHVSAPFHVQVPTIFFILPPTTAASAKQMLKVSDDGKLRVRDPLHKRFEGSQVKALDFVIEVNGSAMDPQGLLNACVSDEAVELKLQRDRNNNNAPQRIECNCLLSCRVVRDFP